MHCDTAIGLLDLYLDHRLTEGKRTSLRTHLDGCESCWNAWNIFRWDKADAHPLLSELETYLGDRFLPYYDSSRGLASDWDASAPTTPSQIRAFFENNAGYLYNLTIWEASGNRPHYLEAAAPAFASPTRILDFGCGIGSDTIALRERGHRVIPCDLPSPHAAFAAWRLERRGHPTHVIDPAMAHYADFEALWIIDTLDHLPHLTLLDRLLSRAHLVVTENVATSRGHGNQRFHHRRTLTRSALPSNITSCIWTSAAHARTRCTSGGSPNADPAGQRPRSTHRPTPAVACGDVNRIATIDCGGNGDRAGRQRVSPASRAGPHCGCTSRTSVPPASRAGPHCGAASEHLTWPDPAGTRCADWSIQLIQAVLVMVMVIPRHRLDDQAVHVGNRDRSRATMPAMA